MKKILIALAILLVPLVVFGALYDFDTGAKNTKIFLTSASATGDRNTTVYIPDEQGILIDDKITQVWGYINFSSPDTTFYQIDTARAWFQYMVEGQWVNAGDSNFLQTDANMLAGFTAGLDEMCTVYPIKAHNAGTVFSDRYRWKIQLCHDSVASVGYVNYRLYGLDYAYPADSLNTY